MQRCARKGLYALGEVRRGHLPTLRFVLANGCPVDADACSAAARCAAPAFPSRVVGMLARQASARAPVCPVPPHRLTSHVCARVCVCLSCVVCVRARACVCAHARVCARACVCVCSRYVCAAAVAVAVCAVPFVPCRQSVRGECARGAVAARACVQGACACACVDSVAAAVRVGSSLKSLDPQAALAPPCTVQCMYSCTVS